MESAGVEHVLENLESHSPADGQIPPPDIWAGHSGGAAGQAPGDCLERLRAEVGVLAADLEAVDRRHAAQHGVLKGEIAHLVRRIARLEAIPRPRPGR